MSDPNADQQLVAAAKAGDLAAVAAALGAGAAPDAHDPAENSALKWAALWGHVPVVQALLAAGADPNGSETHGWTPLMAAAVGGYVETAALLLDSGADADRRQPGSAYELAREKGHSGIIELLEQRGANTRLPPPPEAVPAGWLTRLAPSIETLEAGHRHEVSESWFLAEHPELSPDCVLPFGYCHFDWLALKEQMQPGDGLWEFSSLAHAGELPACTGIALVRNGHPVAAMETLQHHLQFDWRLVDLEFVPRPERVNRDDGAGQSLVFPYFIGPPAEMHGLARIPVSCALCGRVRRGFSLDGAHCPELCPEPYREATDRRAGKHGCVECLRSGRFQFWHDTEVGLLDETGLGQLFHKDQLPSPQLLADAVRELRRTPQFVSCQQELWLVHCADFMVYCGSWEPAHFHYVAPDGDGKAFFLKVAGERWAEWWDAGPCRVLGGNSPVGWGDARCYVFRCRHCGQMRAHFDWY